MGLIARAVEAAGIPTVVVSIARDLTAAAGTPRAVFVKWPLGHPLGEAGAVCQQQTIIFQALSWLIHAPEPGAIRDLHYRWRREVYAEPDWEQLETKG